MFLGVWASAVPATGLASQNFTARAEKPKPPIEKPLTALPVGERLVFDVFWMGIPIGNGTLEVREKVFLGTREAIHLVATARTNDFLSALYPVHDEIHSFVDAKTFRSLEFQKKLREGRYRADEKIRFDYDRQKGFYESFLNQGRKEIELHGDVQDILSSFFWFRLQPVSVGEKLHTVVNSEEKNWDMEIEVLGQETREIRGRGTIHTILVEPKTRFKGILYDRGRAWVYFSSDSRRLPVWITLKTPYGPVVGILQKESFGSH